MKIARSLASLLPWLLLVPAAGAHETEEHKLTASDGAAGDLLGRTVSIRGTELIAGATGHDALGANAGAAYVWSQQGASFVETAKLLASDGAPGDGFGRSVAMGDGVAVIGAEGADTGAVDSGAAYVFVRSGGAWSQAAKLVPSNPVAHGRFGASVAIDDDAVLVGAPGAVEAYLFRGGSGGQGSKSFLWAQEWVMTSKDVDPDGAFGVAVALRGDLAIVGASEHEDRGAAYAFRKLGPLWVEEQKIVPGDRDLGDLFGAAVSIGAENRIMVGAPGDDAQGADAGAAYRFERQGPAWNETLKRVGLTPGDGMGNSVSTSYNFELVGSRFFDYLAPDAGAALLWNAFQSPLTQSFVASDPGAGSLLGNSVSMDGCNLVAGSLGDDGLGSDAGAVYVFAAPQGTAAPVMGSGVNAFAMFTRQAPNIGADWLVDFDTSALPSGDTTILVVSRQLLPTPLPFAAGELLVGFGPQRLMQCIELGSGSVRHTIPIPNDPFLIGAQAVAQGFLHASGTGGLRALNGETLTIGCEYGHTP